MDSFLKELIESKKTYHEITINDGFLLFDFESMKIIKVTDEIRSIINNCSTNVDILRDSISKLGEQGQISICNQLKHLLNRNVLFHEHTHEESPSACRAFNKKSYYRGELSFPTIHACNLKCKYCFASSGENYSQAHKQLAMSDDIIEKAVTYLVYCLAPNAKEYRIDFVSGGEPLLNISMIKRTSQIAEKISKKVKKPIKLWLCTNGTLLTESVAEELDDLRISIGISIDGDCASHNTARKYANGVGTYADAIESINTIRHCNKISAKLKDFWVLSVAHAENLDICQILRHHLEHNFSSIQITPVRLSEDATLSINKHNLPALIEQYALVKDWIVDDIAHEKLDILKIMLNDRDCLGRIVFQILNQQKHIYRCGAGKYKISVTANGDIYPCDSFVGDESMKMGNILSNHIDTHTQNIFENSHVFERDMCKSCWNKYLCGGECYYFAKLLTCSISGTSSAWCDFHKKMSEYAIEIVYALSQNNKIFRAILSFAQKRLLLR